MFHGGSARQSSLKALGIALGLSLLLLGPVHAQDRNSVTNQAPTTGGSDAQRAAGPIEQVIVTGQRSLGSLIREAGDLTEDFYSRLNFVIDNDDFDIDCRNEFPTGSRISTRVCRMRFMDELQNRRSASTLRTIGTNEDGQLTQFGTGDVIRTEWNRKMQEFEDEVVNAVNADAELNQQVIRLIALKSSIDNYDSSR